VASVVLHLCPRCRQEWSGRPVSGGFTTHEQHAPSHALHMYNPATDTWTQKHDMPGIEDSSDPTIGGGAGGATGVINDKLYVLSPCYSDNGAWGYDEGCPSGPWFLRYNPGTDTWTTLPRPDSVVGTHFGSPLQAGVVNGKFYVMGGVSFAVYDPATNKWTKLTTGFARGRAGAAMAVLGSRLYVIGGRRYDAATETWDSLAVTVRYDPTTGTWTRLADLPSPRSDIAASRIYLNGKARIEVVGGRGTGNNLQYTP